jgi:hypothetical protein
MSGSTPGAPKGLTWPKPPASIAAQPDPATSDDAGSDDVRQNKLIKGMDEQEWNRALVHCRGRGENMASFATRAFRQMRERDEAGPRYIPPPPVQPARAAPGVSPALALPVVPVIETAGDLAALMVGLAEVARAAGVPVPEKQAREALTLAKLAVGAALKGARTSKRAGKLPEALRLANERRAREARERRA